ncbi:MAG: hypothetical protein KME45_03555 [Stenomitos rutilans HA7619-LM2]|jgi:hypothetical protein|nr:hypothetical protein [Stenomitos rutilans HA7619-LM2]MBW4469462.1 hypothetical protein [Stenomitos rutilans HA7619-LM2]
MASDWAILDDTGLVVNKIVADATFLEQAYPGKAVPILLDQPCEIGWTHTDGAFIAPTSETVLDYRWVDLENALRGTDLFGVAFANNAALTLITHSFANTAQTDENRFADFTFAVQAIQSQYTQKQRDRFLTTLQNCGFPAIEFS